VRLGTLVIGPAIMSTPGTAMPVTNLPVGDLRVSHIDCLPDSQIDGPKEASIHNSILL
jgi:hypothetical protein